MINKEQIDKIDELKKQVDELTDFKNQVTLFGLYGAGLENGRKKAVKDTAKEICDLILEHWQGHDLVECDWLIVAISEKYGVDMK